MSILNQPLVFLAIPPVRSFAGIKGYVTLTESTVDKLTITKQPVQQGATISDHAFKEPISISITMLFGQNLTQNLNQIYASLLALQQPIPPAILATFTVTTPKRNYNNMLLTTLTCTTNKQTENVLSISATFEECITVPITTTNVPPSQLQNAANNQGTQNAGKKSFLAALTGTNFNSLVSRLGGGS
jgi:hypothetical protein